VCGKVKDKAVLGHACRDSRGTTPPILNLSNIWRSVVNFMPRPLYPQEEIHYPLYRKAFRKYSLKIMEYLLSDTNSLF
jgi:hypothetical protein